jgi:hypothetical protein
MHKSQRNYKYVRYLSNEYHLSVISYKVTEGMQSSSEQGNQWSIIITYLNSIEDKNRWEQIGNKMKMMYTF